MLPFVKTKVLYKKSTLAIDEIKHDIETLLGQYQKSFHYQCSNCRAEYIFYKQLDRFNCLSCDILITYRRREEWS